MPLKLNVGLSKKVGVANYGSRGASVCLEIEMDSGAVADPNRLRGHIRRLYELARASIDEELSRPTNGQASNGQASNGQISNGPAAAPPENSQDDGVPTGAAEYHDDAGPIVRPATTGQVKALWGLAKRQKINLTTLLSDRFQLDRPEHLSLPAASSLIDELTTQGDG